VDRVFITAYRNVTPTGMAGGRVDMSDHGNSSTQILAERLRLGAGFSAEDRGHVLEVLSALNRHLAHWSPEQVDLEMSVKNRGGAEQKVTLEAWLPRWPSVVATSTERDLDHALIDVRKDMIRQIEDEKTRRELNKPRASRRGPA
jgi:ribosome-associated translation inhibitor RaiA